MNEKLAANLILLREALLLGLSMDRRVFVSGGGGALGSAESSVPPSRFAGRSAVTSAGATTCSSLSEMNTNK